MRPLPARHVQAARAQLDGPADLEIDGGQARRDADRALDRVDLGLLRRRQRAVGRPPRERSRAARCRRRSRRGVRARPRTRARASGRSGRTTSSGCRADRRRCGARAGRRIRRGGRAGRAIASPRVAVRGGGRGTRRARVDDDLERRVDVARLAEQRERELRREAIARERVADRAARRCGDTRFAGILPSGILRK